MGRNPDLHQPGRRAIDRERRGERQESPLTVNGNRVGTAADIGDGVIKISYEDGTFETLN